MKKWLALVLAMVMLMMIAPVFAESDAEGDDLSSLFDSLGDSAEEGEGGSSGLGDLLGGLLGGGEGESGGLDLSSILQPLLQKLSSLKDINLSEIVDALKAKFGGLLGGGTRSAEGGEGTDLSSLLGGLLGSDGSENNGEGTDLGSALSGLLGSDGSENDGEGTDLSSLLGGLFGGGSDEEGVSEDDLSSLLGLLLGGESGEDFDLDALIEEYRSSPEYQDYLARIEALKEHLKEEYAETIDMGDLQLLTYMDVVNYEDENPNVMFGYFVLIGYTADGTDLKQAGYAGNLELVTFEKQEDGTFKVTEAVIPEEGEGEEASIRQMCDSYGVTYEEYVESMEFFGWSEMYDKYDFLLENPEYERIEHNGELLTADELDALLDAYFEEADEEVAAE